MEEEGSVEGNADGAYYNDPRKACEGETAEKYDMLLPPPLAKFAARACSPPAVHDRPNRQPAIHKDGMVSMQLGGECFKFPPLGKQCP